MHRLLPQNVLHIIIVNSFLLCHYIRLKIVKHSYELFHTVEIIYIILYFIPSEMLYNYYLFCYLFYSLKNGFKFYIYEINTLTGETDDISHAKLN